MLGKLPGFTDISESIGREDFETGNHSSLTNIRFFFPERKVIREYFWANIMKEVCAGYYHGRI